MQEYNCCMWGKFSIIFSKKSGQSHSNVVRYLFEMTSKVDDIAEMRIEENINRIEDAVLMDQRLKV